MLARWVVHRDEAAFELLIRRHAPMVLAVCRRVLPDSNDSDDAFQATFLVLARKASSVSRGEVLPGWLHRVASRAALRIRADQGKRANREEHGIGQLTVPPSDLSGGELKRILDEEITGLPERQRAAFVLCCLEGKTGEEASRLLGCPPGTVSSRLTRAREQLRDRLTRRGFAPGLAIATLAVLTDNAIVAAPRALIDSTLVAALAFAAGRPLASGYPTTRLIDIAQGVIRTMTPIKIKIAALLVVAGMLTVGGVFAATRPSDDPAQPLPNAKAEKTKTRGDEKNPVVPVVQIVRVQAGGLERIANQVGTVESTQQAQLHPAVTGVLQKVDVNIGDRVKRGQLLAEIDAPSVALDERHATIGVEQAQGLLKEAEACVVTARAESEASKGAVTQRDAEASAAKATLTHLKKKFERVKELANQASVDQRLLGEVEAQLHAAEALSDAAVATVQNAKADTEVKKGKLLQAEATVANAKSNVEAAKLGVEKVRLVIAKTKIHAPFDGVVTRRGCSPGDYVYPGEGGGEGSLFTVMRTDVVRVVVAIPERDISLVLPGVAAEVMFDSLVGMRVSGKVARVGYSVNPANRTMRAEIDVPNPKGDIRPGMFGSVTLKLGKGPADAVRVPVGAVLGLPPSSIDEKANAVVYVYRDGKARRTRVRVSYNDGKEAEILSGLTAEDRIVATPMGLPFGDEITVEVEKPAAPK